MAKRQLIKYRATDPKVKGSQRTSRLVERPISGLNSLGNMHRVAYLADGSLDRKTLCGAWAAQSPATNPSALVDCPVCMRIVAELRLLPVVEG